MRNLLAALPLALTLLGVAAPPGHAERWRTSDDVGTAVFGDPYTGELPGLLPSPDDRMVAVYAENGDLARNRRIGRLRVYRNPPRGSAAGQPLIELVFDDLTIGPAIRSLRWDSDGQGLSFIHGLTGGGEALQHLDLATKQRTELVRASDRILGYAIQSPRRFVYIERDPPPASDPRAPVRAATGQPLVKIQHPALWSTFIDRGRVWLVEDGRRTAIDDPDLHGQAIVFGEAARTLSLSPDGKRLAFAAPAWTYPKDWSDYPSGDGTRTALPPPLTPQEDVGVFGLGRYVVVDLATGEWSAPSAGPTAGSRGWGAEAVPAWSPDSRVVVLPGAFPAKASRPCVLAFDLARRSGSCLLQLQGAGDAKVRTPLELRFDGPDVRIHLIDFPSARTEDEVWTRDRKGGWRRGGEPGAREIGLRIEQSISQPARLVTRGGQTVWDPNRDIRDRVARVEVISWKDRGGVVRQGGLYWPADYRPGVRYPLVVQTHGLAPDEFRPSGIYPGDFAAESLAANGFFVLQAHEACVADAREAECSAEAYRSGVASLAARGLIDPKRVGVSGFSRSCMYSLEALTRYPDLFAAAILFDGVMMSYSEYVETIDMAQNEFARESDVLMGAEPIGDGLKAWMARSPVFQSPKVAASVMIEVPTTSVDSMWEPYALLRLLHRPVELQLVDTEEHPPTEPRIQAAMAGLTVDWFKFWLQGEEDPDPAKAAQYARWRELRAEQARRASDQHADGRKTPAG